VKKVITVSGSPTLTLGGKTSICKGEKHTLVAGGATTYSWSTGAGSSSIAVNPTVTTTYTLYGTSGGCSSSKVFTVSVSDCTGLEKNSEVSQFIISPNPHSGKSFIVESGMTGTIHICNQLGQLVLTQKVSKGKNEIVFEQFGSGVYTASFFSEAGLQVKKFVKQD
jgi:hypothetical protein